MPTELITTETVDEVERALAKTELDLCEGFCRDLPSKTFFVKEMEIACCGCRSRAALARRLDSAKSRLEACALNWVNSRQNAPTDLVIGIRLERPSVGP